MKQTSSISRGILSILIIIVVWALIPINNSWASDPADNDVESEYVPTEVILPTNLKVILVQFNDVKWDSFWVGSQGYRYIYRHKKSNFDSLLTSLGVYANKKNADQDSVLGSFRDYFYQNSRQQYNPTVTILNNTDANGYPIWVDVTGNKSSYTSWQAFLDSADAAAGRAGLDTTTSTYVKLCYIYAGHYSPIIMARADDYHGRVIIVPERWRAHDRTGREDVNDKLSHVGWYCHEFGHIMGWMHLSDASYSWGLMCGGHKNSNDPENIEANRPASMNPWFICKAGWATPTEITSDINDANLIYRLYQSHPTTPSSYYIRQIPHSNIRYLVENRQLANMFDKSLPPAMAGDNLGGLLIWKISDEGMAENGTGIIPADGSDSANNRDDDIFRPDGDYPYEKIYDFSSPAHLRIVEKPCHFAITGYTTNGNSMTVNFKASYFSTNSATATAYNNSRCFISDSYSKYHIVYESDGEIYYEKSSDGGTTWEEGRRLSLGNGNNKYPSIVVSGNKRFVVWQRYKGYSGGYHKYDIYLARPASNPSIWLIETIGNLSDLTFSSQIDPLPVVTYKNPTGTRRLIVCAKSSSYIKYVVSDNDGKTWLTNGDQVPGTASTHKNPSLSMGPTTPASTVYLAYDDNNNIYYNSYTSSWGSAQNVSSGSGLWYNRYPSVEVDGSGGKNFAWKGYSYPLGLWVVAQRRNSEPVQIFTTGGDGGDRASITGHSSNKRSIVYTVDSANEVYRVYYNGSSWSELFVATNA